METDETARTLGRLFAPVIVGLIIAGIIRLTKKRPPTRKESWTIVIVMIAVVILSAIGRQTHP